MKVKKVPNKNKTKIGSKEYYNALKHLAETDKREIKMMIESTKNLKKK